MTHDEILAEIKRRLTEAYGERLRGIIVYGSEARDESGPDSDIDVMVLLDGAIAVWDDIATGVSATYDLAVAIGRPIHPTPGTVHHLESSDFPFYCSVRGEGVRL